MSETKEPASVLDLLLRPELPDVRRVLQEKQVEVKRLSKLTGEKVVFTLRALTYDQVRRIQDHPRGEQAVQGVIQGCVSPDWKDPALLDVSRSIATPADAVKARLTAGEIDELYIEIQALSGYLDRTLADVKNG